MVPVYANDLTADEVISLLGAERQSSTTPPKVRGWWVVSLDRKPFGAGVLTVEHPEWGQRRWQITASAM